MPDYILDTGVLIRHLRNYQGYPELVDRLTGEGGVSISAMTRLEIVRGMRDREQGATFELLDSLETVNVTSSEADQAGELIRFWKAHGTIIGDADVIIAVSALQHELILVTTNPRHFPISGVTVLQADEQGNVSPYKAA
jgi:tRNA(fMet)-specific endonuclease VapC